MRSRGAGRRYKTQWARFTSLLKDHTIQSNMIPLEMPKVSEQRREITPYLLVKKAEEVALEVGLVFWESKLGVSYDL